MYEVHVHLEDRSVRISGRFFFFSNKSISGWVPSCRAQPPPSEAGPSPHVLWDAAYDMGGTEVRLEFHQSQHQTLDWATQPQKNYDGGHFGDQEILSTSIIVGTAIF